MASFKGKSQNDGLLDESNSVCALVAVGFNFSVTVRMADDPAVLSEPLYILSISWYYDTR